MRNWIFVKVLTDQPGLWDSASPATSCGSAGCATTSAPTPTSTAGRWRASTRPRPPTRTPATARCFAWH